MTGELGTRVLAGLQEAWVQPQPPGEGDLAWHKRLGLGGPLTDPSFLHRSQASCTPGPPLAALPADALTGLESPPGRALVSGTLTFCCPVLFSRVEAWPQWQN